MPPKELYQTLAVAAVTFVVLASATYLSYRHTKSRTPQIVLPGGISYLGPTPKQASGQKIPVPDDASWTSWKGQRFPYSFSYPSSLSLGYFSNDPFDAVTIFWGDTNPQENLLLRVENLSADPNNKQYVTKSKRTYVENWWKQYTYAGIQSIAEFTTASKLKGYRAHYQDSLGKVPYEQIFLEVPGKAELVIWMSQKLLEKPIFDRMVDSLIWKNP